MNIREVSSMKIGAVRYKVLHEKLPPPENEEDKDRIHLGNINYAQAIIRIDNDTPDEVAIVTSVHEAIHGLLYHSGNYQLPEDGIEGLTNTLILFIQNNPQLIQAIQERK